MMGATIVITTEFGPQPVEVSWQQDGLAVHVGEWYEDTGFPCGWTVTHVASGFHVRTDINTVEEAVDLAAALLPCGDWTQPFFAIHADRSLFRRAHAVLREWGYKRGAPSAERVRKHLEPYQPVAS